MEPFLSIDDFAEQFSGTLTDPEKTVAERLLETVSDWIRGQKPDVDEREAEQVVFEVVRDATNYGAVQLLSDFNNETSRRREAGKFDARLKATVEDYLTGPQKIRLGIRVGPKPAYTFGD